MISLDIINDASGMNFVETPNRGSTTTEEVNKKVYSIEGSEKSSFDLIQNNLSGIVNGIYYAKGEGESYLTEVSDLFRKITRIMLKQNQRVGKTEIKYFVNGNKAGAFLSMNFKQIPAE